MNQDIVYNYHVTVIQSMDTEINVYRDSNVQKPDLLIIEHLNACLTVHFNHNNMEHKLEMEHNLEINVYQSVRIIHMQIIKQESVFLDVQ